MYFLWGAGFGLKITRMHTNACIVVENRPLYKWGAICCVRLECPLPPPAVYGPESPRDTLLKTDCMSQRLSQAFQEWRDPYYATSSVTPPPVHFVRKVSRSGFSVPPSGADSPKKILGSYSLSSSDSEVEVHPTQPRVCTPPPTKSLVVQPALQALDVDDGVTQFEFSDAHTFSPLRP